MGLLVDRHQTGSFQLVTQVSFWWINIKLHRWVPLVRTHVGIDFLFNRVKVAVKVKVTRSRLKRLHFLLEWLCECEWVSEYKLVSKWSSKILSIHVNLHIFVCSFVCSFIDEWMKRGNSYEYLILERALSRCMPCPILFFWIKYVWTNITHVYPHMMQNKHCRGL